MKMKQVEIASALVPLLKGWTNPNSIRATLGIITNGKRALPEEWEQPLMTVLGCADRDALREVFPAIRFKNEQRALEECEISITFSVTQGVLPVKNIEDVIRALKVLERFGIKSEWHIRGK